MIEHKFKEKDSENLVKLLNMLGEKAKFKLNVKETITLYGLLAWAQHDLKKKIDANILEVRAVREPEPVEQPKRTARKAKS